MPRPRYRQDPLPIGPDAASAPGGAPPGAAALLLAGFTKVFRKRLQVPEEVPSIKDQSLQKHHQDWIEAFLMQQMKGHSY
jgi:hypothetical protein